MESNKIEECINNAVKEFYDDKIELKEFTGGILKALKVVGGTVATYYLFKQLVYSILTDKKFVSNMSQKIADRLDYLEKRKIDKYLLNPNNKIK